MTKLQVWATVTEAYRAIWTHRWALLRFAAIPFVLIVAIDLASLELGQDYGVSPSGGELDAWPSRALALSQAGQVLGALIAIAFVVPCYRLLLLGPVVVKGGESWPARRVYLAMVALTLVLTVLMEGPMTFVDFMLESSGGRFWPIVGLSYFAVFLLIAVRLAFLYPAICLGERWQLSTRWRQTAGNFWRLLAVYSLSLLPLLIASVLWVASEDLWEGTALGTSTSAAAVESLLSTLDWLVGEALWAAVTVVAFATLTGYPAKGVRVLGRPTG